MLNGKSAHFRAIWQTPFSSLTVDMTGRIAQLPTSAGPRWGVVTLVYPHSLLVLEAVLMTAFGISWFAKGGKLLARPSTA